MKVYFSGSHSQGKSTLVKYVSQKYNLPIVNETARTILSEQELQIDSLRCNIDIANKYQKDVFGRQLIEEVKYIDYVSDRSLIDILAYTTHHSNILPDMLAHPQLPDYLLNLKKPDVFSFFIRPSKATLRADGTRESINWDGVISIDASIKTFFKMWDIRHFQINADNMQERVHLIDAVLSNQL